MISPSSPITGSAITGLTSPTYTLTVDNPPNSNAKAYVITSLGGTQTGVVAHSNMMPFRAVVKRPARVKIPGQRSMTTGMYLTGGKNEYSYTFVKGANITGSASNPQYDNIVAKLTIAVPAAIGNDSAQLDALFSFMGGFIANTLQGLRDTTGNSVL